jgi:hypothetical protein
MSGLAKRRTAGVTGVMLLVLSLFIVIGVPAGATPNPPGNNGTVKIDGVEFDIHPDNEPHVGCVFQVDFYGYDFGQLFADVTFTVHPPTGSPVVLLTDVVFIGEDDNAGGGSVAGLDAEVEYNLGPALLAGGYAQHPQQGWHVKLTVNAEGSQGADVKHKVFWVGGCIPPTTTTTVPPTTTTSAPTTTTTTASTTTSGPTTTTTAASTTTSGPTTTTTTTTTTAASTTTSGPTTTTTAASTTTSGPTTTTTTTAAPTTTTTRVVTDSPPTTPSTTATTLPFDSVLESQVLGIQATAPAPAQVAAQVAAQVGPTTADTLPFTGASTGSMAGLAAALAAGGAILLVASRRVEEKSTERSWN